MTIPKLATILAALVFATPAIAEETWKNSQFVWPKNSQFSCRGVLEDQSSWLRLRPDKGMLAWCNAYFEGQEKTRALTTCAIGERCEIKGTIQGHGDFQWTKVNSVRRVEAATKLSTALTGEYCNGSQDGSEYAYCAPGDWESRTDNWLVLTPTHLHGHEVSCKFISVNEHLDSVRVTKVDYIGASRANVVAKCDGEGCEWRVRMTITMFRGILTVKTNRIGKEVCRG